MELNTVDTQEYRRWLALLSEITNIQDAIKQNPNQKGLRLARSHAYNLLADIQSLLDYQDTEKEQPIRRAVNG